MDNTPPTEFVLWIRLLKIHESASLASMAQNIIAMIFYKPNISDIY